MNVIIAYQMENPMDQQLIEALHCLHSSVNGFLMGRVNRNHHITQKIRCDLGKRSLLHGKGNDIGRAVMVEIGGIKLGDLLIIHNQNRKLPFRIAQGA